MSDQLKAGDIVQLKSGGPYMTVSKLREWQGRIEAHCDWFEGTKATYGSFPVTSLKIVTEHEEHEGHETGTSATLTGGSSTGWMR